MVLCWLMHTGKAERIVVSIVNLPCSVLLCKLLVSEDPWSLLIHYGECEGIPGGVTLLQKLNAPCFQQVAVVGVNILN